MICPRCKEEGKKSKIYQDGMGGFRTAMGLQAYWDEDGKYHIHDPNSTTNSYICSNGHHIVETTKQPCAACNYNQASYKMDVT